MTADDQAAETGATDHSVDTRNLSYVAHALLDRARSVASVPPVGHAVASAEALLDQLPSMSKQLDVVVRELHAKRLTVQAVQQELVVLDEQLEVLERSLAPVEKWLGLWGGARSWLHHTVDSPVTPTSTGPSS